MLSALSCEPGCSKADLSSVPTAFWTIYIIPADSVTSLRAFTLREAFITRPFISAPNSTGLQSEVQLLFAC